MEMESKKENSVRFLFNCIINNIFGDYIFGKFNRKFIIFGNWCRSSEKNKI